MSLWYLNISETCNILNKMVQIDGSVDVFDNQNFIMIGSLGKGKRQRNRSNRNAYRYQRALLENFLWEVVFEIFLYLLIFAYIRFRDTRIFKITMLLFHPLFIIFFYNFRTVWNIEFIFLWCTKRVELIFLDIYFDTNFYMRWGFQGSRYGERVVGECNKFV